MKESLRITTIAGVSGNSTIGTWIAEGADTAPALPLMTAIVLLPLMFPTNASRLVSQCWFRLHLDERSLIFAANRRGLRRLDTFVLRNILFVWESG